MTAVRRITFFVADAQATATGWVVRGEVGLGPIAIGDDFSFVHHQDVHDEEPVGLEVRSIGDGSLEVVGERRGRLRAGDILGGEVA